MKIAIIGSGGVGGYFGGKIAHAGFDVTFVARGDHMKAMRMNGLTVRSIYGDFTVKPVKVTDKTEDIRGAQFILLGVKAWQVRDVARRLKDIIGPETTVLPLQNGILAAEELSAELGNSHVIGGLCRIFSKIDSPGIISHLGMEPAILFGELNNAVTSRAETLKEIFVKSGITGLIAHDIQAELWKKFINICASGLLAVCRSTYGEIRELKETRGLMIALFEEIYQISVKIGIGIDHEFVDKTMAFVDTYPYDFTSSLTRDIWEGKPSELEYQNGTVIRLGEQYGVPTPVNSFIYKCLLPMELRARKQI